MGWTLDEPWPPIFVDPANPNVTDLTLTVGSNSPTFQVQTPNVTLSTPIVNEGYPETHMAIVEEDASWQEEMTPPTLSVSINPFQPNTTQTVNFAVTAYDNTRGIGIAEIRLRVNGESVTWTTEGTHIYTVGSGWTRLFVSVHFCFDFVFGG